MVAADEKIRVAGRRHAQCVRFDDGLGHPQLLEGHVGQFKDRTPEIELREPGTSRRRRSSKACRPEVSRAACRFTRRARRGTYLEEMRFRFLRSSPRRDAACSTSRRDGTANFERIDET